MNFKRFNGSTWETVQHKIYGSGTDSLAAFPAQIQAAGEPLIDYTISGNTLQDGTPTPEAPVDVVGCGDWDATAQQYKLPLTVNGVEYPIYLGQAETTRKIKKLTLTGQENFEHYGASVFWVKVEDNYAIINGYGVSNSYVFNPIVLNVPTTIANNEFCLTSSNGRLWIRNTNYSNASIFKVYLSQQYAAGTPVTVWYVLAEPETGIVNEPLNKIGSYTDTITMAQAGVTIPTFDGDNTISFGTTVQPSAMSATFKGWHPVQGAKQYDGSEWR